MKARADAFWFQRPQQFAENDGRRGGEVAEGLDLATRGAEKLDLGATGGGDSAAARSGPSGAAPGSRKRTQPTTRSMRILLNWGRDMSQYTAEEEETRSQKLPSTNPWDMDLEVFADYWSCTPLRSQKLPSTNPWDKDLEVFADDPPVMDWSDHFHYHFQPPVEAGLRRGTLPSLTDCYDHIDYHFQRRVIHRYQAAKKNPPFPQLPSPSPGMDYTYPEYLTTEIKPPDMDSHMCYKELGSRERSEQLALDHKTVMDCLRHYNSMCPGVEYEPAPGEGEVNQHCKPNYGTVWIHGNFVARQKRSGCLPGPRTLFFFELKYIKCSSEVITCTPLLDEPVTEAYSVFGFPLWRSGKYDSICKTCKCRLEKGILACGHKEMEELCKMCYARTDVLHPSAGEFAFGNEEC